MLLLNRVLSVRAGAAGSHRGKGWEAITTAAVTAARAARTSADGGAPAARCDPVGQGRRAVRPLLGGRPAVVQRPSQPALGVAGGFFGSRPFSAGQRLLAGAGADGRGPGNCRRCPSLGLPYEHDFRPLPAPRPQELRAPDHPHGPAPREQLSPHMVRIVAGGPGFAGYVNNDYVDRYVKIVFPQPGVEYPDPLDLWAIRETMPRESVAAHPDLHGPLGGPGGAGTGHRLRDPRRRRPRRALGGRRPARRPPDLHRPRRRLQPGPGRRLVPVCRRRIRAAGHRRRHRIPAAGRPRPRLPRSGQRRRHPAHRRAGRRRAALAAARRRTRRRQRPAGQRRARRRVARGPGDRSLPTASAAT